MDGLTQRLPFVSVFAQRACYVGHFVYVIGFFVLRFTCLVRGSSFELLVVETIGL
jgi:hypothetical protein